MAIIGLSWDIRHETKGHEKIDVWKGIRNLSSVHDVIEDGCPPLPGVGIHKKGTVRAGTEIDTVLLKDNVPFPVPARKDDSPWSRAKGSFDHKRGDLHQGVILGVCTPFFEELDRILFINLHPDTLQDFKTPAQDLLNLIV